MLDGGEAVGVDEELDLALVAEAAERGAPVAGGCPAAADEEAAVRLRICLFEFGRPRRS